MTDVRTNTNDNVISYISTTIILLVLFALPLVSFLLAGLYDMDIAGYGIKDQSEPLSPRVGIPDSVLTNLSIAQNDVVVVTPSIYDNAMETVSGVMPWVFFVFIILTPLSELLQYFLLRRKGIELDLVTKRHLLLVVAYLLVVVMGGMLIYVCGDGITLSMGLELDVVMSNLAVLDTFIGIIIGAVIACIILWAIPIIHSIYKTFSKSKSDDILDDDEAEFINDSKISEE